MPPWRKGRGLGPFTAARPAAGPLLGSQLVCPQTTQNSRPLGDPGHANEHLWSVARAATRPPLLALPTDMAPPTGRTRLAVLGVDRYGGGSGASHSKARSTRLLPDQTWVRAAATHVGWEPMRRQLSAASPGEPVGRPAVASGQVGASRGRAVSPRRCRHAGWDPALRFGAGLGGYSCDTGTSPSRQRDQVLVLPVWRLPGNQSAPFPRSTACSECAPILGRAFAACRVGVLSDSAHAHHHPVRVIKPGRH
jgi:hypothetical protein